MKSKTKKGKKEINLIAIGLVQIFILIILIPSNSYFIAQSNDLIENTSIANNKNKGNFLSNLVNLLTGFLSIKQIGIVSANDDTWWCCEILDSNDATCQDISAGNDSLCDSNGQVWYTNCELTSLCKTGTCIDEEYGTCSPGTEKECGDNWDPLLINEIPECKLGCCSLEEGTRKEWWTNLKCNNEEGSFDNNIPQSECKVLTEEMGACVLDNNNCIFTTEENCVNNLNGNSWKGFLCSNPNLNTICGRPQTKQEIQTTCYNDRVYFLDNCSNIANIYDSSEWDVDDYWKFVQTSACDAVDNPETCGNCDSSSNICASSSEAGINPEQGNYVCKDVTCVDDKGINRLNGESWCVYESYIGNSKDVVGSQHWLKWCENGKVKTDLCNEYRGKICTQKDITTVEGSISMARCRFNEGWKGFQIKAVSYEYDEDDLSITNQEDVDKYIAECNILSDNRIQSVDLYHQNDKDLFKFDVCVPKYPPALKHWDSGSNAGNICSIASTECTIIEQKNIFGNWKCKANCKCKEQSFAKQMNDLCISLGDCGGYVNIEEKYTKNFRVKGGKNSISTDKINEYKSNARDENIGKGDLPEFFSSSEKGYFGGDPIEEIDWLGKEFAGLKVFTTIVGIIGTTVGSVTGWEIAKGIFIASIKLPGLGTFITFIVAALVMLWTFFTGAGKTREKTISFECLPWQPPRGGDDCDKCGDEELPCTEYKCRSLGTACRLIDESELYESENPKCIDKYPDDVTPPQISLKSIQEGYEFTEENNKVKIRAQGEECIQEFTPINFTLQTKNENDEDDYAKCVYNWEPIAPNPENDYANIREGELFREKNTYSITHGFENRLPFVSSEYVSGVDGDLGERTGEVNLYVRCEDFSGNFNFNEYIVNFCIKEGPDNEIATIRQFIPETGSFLKWGGTNKSLIIKLDEPAECKWSNTEDKSYENMENSMICDDYTGKIEPSWSCKTILTGLTQTVNNIYIKCKDQPWISEENYTGPWSQTDRNVNTQGFPYTLYATQTPLNITAISPQGTVEIGGTVSEIFLEATTTGGMDNGISVCKYLFVQSPSGITSEDFFSQTSSTIHKQPFSPPTGDYNIAIKCKDDAGNKAQGNAVFNLIKDPDFPKAVRVYKSGSSLKLITDEQASCYYSFKDCRFDFNDENINSMTTAYSTEHTANWNAGQKYYIKCKDMWKNSGCSIIVSLA